MKQRRATCKFLSHNIECFDWFKKQLQCHLILFVSLCVCFTQFIYWVVSRENIFYLVSVTANVMLLSSLGTKNKKLIESPTGPWYQTYVESHYSAMFQINGNNQLSLLSATCTKQVLWVWEWALKYHSMLFSWKKRTILDPDIKRF